MSKYDESFTCLPNTACSNNLFALLWRHVHEHRLQKYVCKSDKIPQKKRPDTEKVELTVGKCSEPLQGQIDQELPGPKCTRHPKTYVCVFSRLINAPIRVHFYSFYSLHFLAQYVYGWAFRHTASAAVLLPAASVHIRRPLELERTLNELPSYAFASVSPRNSEEGCVLRGPRNAWSVRPLRNCRLLSVRFRVGHVPAATAAASCPSRSRSAARAACSGSLAMMHQANASRLQLRANRCNLIMPFRTYGLRTHDFSTYESYVRTSVPMQLSLRV